MNLEQKITELDSALLSNLIEHGAATPEDIVLYEISQGRGTWDGLLAALRYSKVLGRHGDAGDVLADTLARLADDRRIRLGGAVEGRRLYEAA